MQRSAAWIGSAVFFVVAPGVVAGLVPWLITGWQVRGPMSPFAIARMMAGGVLLVAGVVVQADGEAAYVDAAVMEAA